MSVRVGPLVAEDHRDRVTREAPLLQRVVKRAGQDPVSAAVDVAEHRNQRLKASGLVVGLGLNDVERLAPH
jgi:hypothetical protein